MVRLTSGNGSLFTPQPKRQREDKRRQEKTRENKRKQEKTRENKTRQEERKYSMERTGYYHSATMTDLVPNTNYQYYVGAPPEFFSDVYQFRSSHNDGPLHFIGLSLLISFVVGFMVLGTLY
jgi:Purple acid Phosphatase, N-terminal domain